MTIDTSQIDTIVFDLGGVLIDWNPKYLYQKIFRSEESMNHFLHSICTSDWNEEQDAGRSLSEATSLLTESHPYYHNEINSYYDRWPEMLGGPIRIMVDLLRDLKTQNKYRLLALTNWSAETFPIAQEQFEFLSWFKGIVVSGEEYCKKPDQRIYQILMDRYDVQSNHILFLDDNQRNIQAAKKLGWQGVQIIEHKYDVTRLRTSLL